ncbi:ABC transporter permease [Numidum massiliense]|uniref:ABC transporter permease n=1 Tax=Numidum massiliense TaxID=1522315 RepID=UPI0006D58B6B|nr:ABC transporter permease [Numidum massiliense]
MDILSDVLVYFTQNTEYLLQASLRHFLLAFYGVLFAAIVGIPIGIFIARHHRLSGFVIGLANVIQTVPALAMLVLLMLVMGLGPNTVVMALFLYSLLPIIKNTYTGIRGVDASLREAGRGMGMTRWQMVKMVELPLALSVIMAGLRIAMVLSIGIATIGVFVGGGGLGSIIVRGINATNGEAIVLGGAIPSALMVIVVDLVMGWLERLLLPVKTNKKGLAPAAAAE